MQNFSLDPALDLLWVAQGVLYLRDQNSTVFGSFGIAFH